MKRREFLAAACAAGTMSVTAESVHSQEPARKRMFIEYRQITAPNQERLRELVKYNETMYIPAFDRYGVAPMGLFVADPQLNAEYEKYDRKYDMMMFGLFPFPSLDSSVELTEKLLKDTEILATRAKLEAERTSKDPLFTAHERMFFRCLEGFPDIIVPPLTPDRILRLRFYRSHSFARNRAKIDMLFNGGEVALMKECGIKPIFFAEVICGPFMPSIVSMLSFDNEEEMKETWPKFINHPERKRLSDNPAFADVATEVIAVCLRPCKGSQI